MAVAGSLTYDTDINKNGFKKGLKDLEKTTQSTGSRIKSIVAGLGIDKLISATFNVISGSIDGAISRLDTLNNYPKVMSNLGVASKDAEKSIKKMSDKLSGLPTTLDAGALAVQRFTSANGNVKKSTDYFLALNNAILAGGASSEIQSSALEQLSQAYAKGKPDMMEWRSLMTAMPAQLKQVATAMGYVSTDKLGEDLRKGKVSMDDFMNKLVELNEKGTGKFQSFEEQARNSTGGIATSITVAKTQVVKGVTDIINSIDQFLKDEGLGGIGNIISELGKKSKELLDEVAKKLPEILNWIIENKNTIEILVGVVLSLVGAYEAYKLTLLIIKGINIVSSIWGTISAFVQLIPAIKSVKDAMLLLNIAFSINPIALIVGAIVALIAIFVVLWKKCDWFRNFWIGLWEGIKSVFEKVWNAIASFFTETIPRWFNHLVAFVRGFKEGFTNTLKEMWNNIVTFFTEGIPNFISSVIQWFKDLPYKIGYLIGQILGNIIQFGINAWIWVTETLPQIIQGIITWFQELPGKIWEWLLKVINDIITWGQNVKDNAVNKISEMIEAIVEFFKALPGRIWEWLLNTISKIAQFAKDMATKGKEGAANLFKNIVDKIKELPQKMLDIGKNIVEGIWNGIKNAKDWIVRKIKEFAKGIFDGMKDALGIHSPSTLFRDGIGKFIPQGVAVGIEADTDSALKAIDSMNNDIIDRMNRAVSVETGSINANASVKSNNSMLNIIQATFNIDGSVDIDGQKAGRLITPYVTKTLRGAGAY